MMSIIAPLRRSALSEKETLEPPDENQDNGVGHGTMFEPERSQENTRTPHTNARRTTPGARTDTAASGRRLLSKLMVMNPANGNMGMIHIQSFPTISAC